ncbi:MAG: hypothetical protein HYX40_09780 [Sphingobacteriales bacterium]|nr:hypothetical protein [Sphingobacteriales bacterium]
MKYIFLLPLSFFFYNAFTQTASFKEIRMRPNPKYYKTSDITIIYPLISTKNSKTDQLINNSIRTAIIGEEDVKGSLKAALLHMSADGTTDLSYEITYNKNWVLSLTIYSQGCGAYCSSSYNYLNFDLKTGKEIEAGDLIIKEKKDSLEKIILAKKTNSLSNYKKEELSMLNNDEIDTATYEWAIQEVDSVCIKEISLQNFVISKNNIEFKSDCDFPHIIKSQEPFLELKFSLVFLKSFLAPVYRQRLIK